MDRRTSRSFLSWLREPSSWLSLIATAVSLTTLYLVQVHPGTVEVVLPVEVGLKSVDGKLELLAPLTLTNTGAPHRRRHLLMVVAELRPRESSDAKPVMLRWESEWKFIGFLEFNQKYPGRGEPGVDDYIDYVSRATPLTIAGGESMTKVMSFRQRDGSTEPSLATFDLRITAKTEDHQFTHKAVAFRCAARLQSVKFDWCGRLDEAR